MNMSVWNTSCLIDRELCPGSGFRPSSMAHLWWWGSDLDWPCYISESYTREPQLNICPLKAVSSAGTDHQNQVSFRQWDAERQARLWPNPNLACLNVGGCVGVCDRVCDLLLFSPFYVPASLPRLKFHASGLTGVILSAELYYLSLSDRGALGCRSACVFVIRPKAFCQAFVFTPVYQRTRSVGWETVSLDVGIKSCFCSTLHFGKM